MKGRNVLEVLLGITLAVIAFYFSSKLDFLEGYGYIGAFFVALISSATVILPAPGWAIIGGMASFLNPFLLGIVAGAGSAIGELTGYMIGYGGGESIDRRRLPEYRRQEGWLKSADIVALFVLAALPNPIFDVAGMAAGALRIPVWRFMLAVALGKILKFTAIAYLGGFATAYL